MYQGHMGAGILAGFFVFIALSAIFSLYTPLCYQSGGAPSCAPAPNIFKSAVAGFGTLGGVSDGNIVSMLTGSSLLTFLPLFVGAGAAGGFVISPIAILLAVIAPVVAGLIAGLISRGGAGNGFIAGFSGVVVGYYLMFIFLFLYLLANGLQIGAITSQMVIPLIGVILIIPIMVGILGGAGGAITAAFFGFPQVPIPYSRPVSTVTTTIMQAPSAPLAAAQAKAVAQSGASAACPACGADIEHDLTFCQSCGERLK